MKISNMPKPYSYPNMITFRLIDNGYLILKKMLNKNTS